MPRIAVVIVAGGSGSRMLSSGSPKQYLRFSGKAVLQHTIEAFLAHHEISRIQLVVNPLHDVYYSSILEIFDRRMVSSSKAGSTRAESVFSGLMDLKRHEPDYVLIHDAVRPLVSLGLIDAVIKHLLNGAQGVVPAIEVRDTVVKRRSDYVEGVLEREELVFLQTPQGFIFKEILDAYTASSGSYTDDVTLAETSGIKVKLIPGDQKNFKITFPFDLEVATLLLS
ncbi:2-C-methyl-D-erythritol 4-phosphate cytidylyltransferase [Neorickettsia helminthoeca str. Oregon]|uniref:2-C-methyl-D-erythritol 4-phosphate cytidylyltransferase n=1 Tax=Neorickettsia helminthoeca str. Oregon TaxID=1286528 RepID=X5GVN9_9RICK|nr:2-C-methyl-D-erythritol 4-phosphate cytidylyltransferase [Neorickettsia helminthoeca]AHX11127.1 2-C-methyl-D-erythritol 4-phosphate cytidylyltransferase [Neorickettsia helminthoeca str. Oregon]